MPDVCGPTMPFTLWHWVDRLEASKGAARWWARRHAGVKSSGGEPPCVHARVDFDLPVARREAAARARQPAAAPPTRTCIREALTVARPGSPRSGLVLMALPAECAPTRLENDHQCPEELPFKRQERRASCYPQDKDLIRYTVDGRSAIVFVR